MDQEEEERLEQICGIDDDIKDSFKTLLDANEENGQNIDLFLSNLVKIFLSNRMFDPEFDPEVNDNALIYCCQKLKYNSAFALLDNPNIDVNEQNNEGDTALMYCSESDDEMSFRVAEKLIEKGARVELINDKERNALLFCCIHDSYAPTLQVALLLLDIDAHDHQFQVDYRGNTGLEYLLNFERPDHEGAEEEYKNRLCSNETYVALVVKYLDLYKKKRQTDPIFEQCMEIICNDEKLRTTFNKPLADVDIRLYSYCKEPKPAIATYQSTLTAQPLPEGITDELAVEAVEPEFEMRAPPESHELRWVRPEDEHLYERQGGPKVLDRSGGKRKRTKRRVPKQKKNKVTRRKKSQR